MMIRNIKAILSIMVVVLLMVFIFNSTERIKDDTMIVKVLNFNANYEKIERELKLEDFEKKVQLGMSMREIEKIIGEPNGWRGGGIMTPYYEVMDSTSPQYVMLYFENPTVLDKLNKVVLVDDKLELEIIKQ